MATAPLLFPAKFQSQLGWRQSIDVEGLPIGIPSFDAILGGCPRGRITEVVGAASSGRTSLVHRILSAAGERGEYCAVVDAANSFDPWTASQAGADLDALVWVQCGHNVEHAMKSADLLIHSGGFGVVILDLCDVTAASTGRIPLSWWYRFQRAVEKTPTILLVLGREAHAKACTALTVEVQREDASFDGSFPFQLLKAARYRVAARKPLGSVGAFLARGTA
ncbi:MAG TPA: hypothetical protein VGL53_09125 [Bryobacteraceae bacterium]|jgi:hypothetical protein